MSKKFDDFRDYLETNDIGLTITQFEAAQAFFNSYVMVSGKGGGKTFLINTIKQFDDQCNKVG